MPLTHAFLAAIVLAQPPHTARRTAGLDRLAGNLLIVPSRTSFKSDDQSSFQQASDFQYLTGLSDLVGAVLVLDGSSKSAVLFRSPRHPAISRPVPAFGMESARQLDLSNILPIDSLAPELRRRLPKAKGVLVSSTDLRGAVGGPAPIAGTVDRWAAYLTTLGWKGPVGPAVSVVGPLRAIKDTGELAIFERVGRMSGQEETVSIDIETPRLDDSAVADAVMLANEIVTRNLAVRAWFPSDDELASLALRRTPDVRGPLRVVGIGDFDFSACGGTHVAATGELGLISVLKTERLTRGMRVEFLTGGRARSDYARKHALVRELSAALTCSPSELTLSVARLSSALVDARRQVAGLVERELDTEAARRLDTA